MAKYSGAVICQADDELIAAMQLLSHRMRQQIEYVHYETPTEINRGRKLDFILLGQIEVLQQVVSRYTQLKADVPLIIHLVYEEKWLNFDYQKFFAYVRVVPILQAILDDADDTLQIDLFEQVIEAITQ